MRLRPTRRGVGLVLLGAALATLGTAIGSVDLLTLGALPVVAVVLAAASVAVVDPGRGRGLRTRRRVTPNPVHAGGTWTAEVEVAATSAGGRARLAGLRLREQAAVELSGGRPLRAQVHREPGVVRLRYPSVAVRRGRWPLGPLVVTRTDPFGMIQVRATLGDREHLAVWPAVVALPVPLELAGAEPEHAVVGAHTPSTDDAALRDYRTGDDLRRVHWRSSARRGELVVRSDERTGLRPVTVLLDPGPAGAPLEWSITLAASVALAMHDAGHPTRLVPAGAAAHAGGPPTDATSRAELLDLTVDLDGYPDEAAGRAALIAAARTVDADAAGGLVVAVLGPQDAAGRAALAALSRARPCWAVVRGAPDAPVTTATTAALVRAGWRVVAAEPGSDPAAAWRRLVGVA